MASNKLKNKEQEEPKTEEVKPKITEISPERKKNIAKITGLFLIVFAVILFISISSYLFTWKHDQDKLFLSLGDFIFNTDVQVKNALGKFGAIVAHFFVFNLFGISAFALVPLTFILGVKLLTGKSLVKLSKLVFNTLLILFYGSIVLGFLFYAFNKLWGGAIGFAIARWCISFIGIFGTSIIHLFVIGAYATIKFNLNYDFILKIFENNKKSNLVADNDDESLKDDLKKFEVPDVYTHQSEIIPANNEEEVSNTDDLEELKLDSLDDEEISVEEAEQGLELIVKQPEVQKNSSNNDLTLEVETHEEPEQAEINEEIEEEENENIEAAEEEDNLDLEVTSVKEKILSEDDVEEKSASLVDQFGEYDPRLDLSDFRFPTLELLRMHGSDKILVNKDELEANKNKIVDTLRNYNIDIAKIKATIGPTVTLYEIVPAPGVRISKIKNLEDDIALSLAALGIRIIAPIPGKGTIGIEVPNLNPEIVSMRTMIASEKFQQTDASLPIILGKTITNEIFIADLAKMPHLLMAGATGQGKSVGLNTILVSLLYKKHPSEIKFVLVDPKKVELTLFNKIERHYLAKLPDSDEAIITDTKKVINTLNSLCIEMDSRYELLKDAQVRNLKEYNQKFISRKLNPNLGHRFLPFIVLVVDEFADLIMTAGKEVETPIARLAQLARAIGIHLIIATQRPSVNIITGTIKANFPARIAFRVTSKIDSRTILDTGGADQLIGRGDMLLSTGNDLIRLQCPFVDTPEVDLICDFIGNQRAYPDPYHLPEYIGDSDEDSDKEEFLMEDRDKLFEEAAKLVVIHQQGSASLLQRRLKLGYNRAGRLVDQLEAAGILGPFEGSKARQVLIKDEISLERFLATLK